MAERLYIQIDATFFANRKVRRVGLAGWAIFQYLLACHRVNPALGWISRSDAHPEQISVAMSAFASEIDEAVATDSLRKLHEAGMIASDAEGNVFLVGWEEWHGPQSSTERSRRYRDRQKAKRDPGKAGTQRPETSQVPEGNSVSGGLQRDATDATHCDEGNDGDDCNACNDPPLLSSPLLSARAPLGTPSQGITGPPAARGPREDDHHDPGGFAVSGSGFPRRTSPSTRGPRRVGEVIDRLIGLEAADG